MTIVDSDDSFLSANSGDDSFVSIPSLDDFLQSQFSNVPKNFNVVHINAQSIPAHFPDMLANLDSPNLHAILISESWLKPCLPSISYSIPGFQLLRNDRTGFGGGGVAIYIRDYISCSIVSFSTQPPPSNAGEHLFLELELNHTKLLLGVYYSPSLRIDYFASLELLLENLTPSYDHTIIMGDFNTCLLKNDSRALSLKSVIQSCNLSILPLQPTHHLPNCTKSLLDLIFVSSTEHVVTHGQCSADAFSYHDLIYLSYKIRPPKANRRVLLQRNFGGMDHGTLRRDASSIDWKPLIEANSIDNKVNIFNESLLNLYDVHAPIRSIKIKHLPSPWLTKEIKGFMKLKNAAKSRYKHRPTAINLEKYIAARNHCNKMCRNAQRQHIHASVENGDPARVWKFLKSLGVGRARNNDTPTDLNIDSLNLHFSSSPDFNGTNKTNTLKHLSSLPTHDCSPFEFLQFADCDVRKSILAISSNAVGSDCVSRNMIIPILDEILPIISHILNQSISSGIFPTVWKQAQIIPLPKKTQPLSFSDYRPISILPFLSKVLERLVHSQLSTFLTQNLLLNPFQSGFRTGHSTTTALANITDDIRLGMDCGNLTVLSLLDFSNAFNTVDFLILLGILRSLNISPTAIAWFHSYLFGRRQRVRIDDRYSDWASTTAGVPQGGVLSPLLFAIFINSISRNLTSSYHLYADDLQIYTQAPLNTLWQAVMTMNTDLERICDWSNNYGLSVNPLKTQLIIIGSSRMLAKINWSTLPQVNFNGTILPITTKVKNLGVCIDSTLSWVPQMQEVSRKLFASAASLRRIQNFLPTATKIALAQSLLLPILDYADVSYLNLTEAQLDKLERLQNVCIRFIFGLRKYDHISEFRKKLKWLPVRFRRNIHVLTLLFNVLFNPTSPSYLKERFQFLHDTHSKYLRSSENLRLAVPKHSTHFYGLSFSVQAVLLWNALPENIRKAQTVTSFKSQLTQYYLTLQ